MASWKQFAEETGIYTLPPKERDDAFNKWENDVLTAQTKSGAFDDPNQVGKIVHYIEQKRGEISRDPFDPPTPEETAKAVKGRFSEIDSLTPDPQAFRKADAEVSSGKAPARHVGGRIIVSPQALKDPKAYREAILATDAPPLVKAKYASQRDAMLKNATVNRRNELAGTFSPHATEIVEELQDFQEYMGSDLRNAKDIEKDFALQKDEDGNWTVPKPAGFSVGRFLKGLVTTGTSEATRDINRVAVKELAEYQKKHGLSDEEMQADYVDALKRSAPSSVSRWFGRKTDLESISPELDSKTRVINKDIAPEVITPDDNLVFKKKDYDAAIDATPGVDDEVKQAAKDKREATAQLLAPQLFNALRNNRSDFENYAKSADMVKGRDAPKAMVKAVEDYYADKQDQSWLQDLGEFAGQQGSALQEGFLRTSAMPYAVAGFLGNDKAARLTADLARGLDSQAKADAMVSANIGMPGTTQFVRDFTNIVPDVAAQVALAIPTGGLTAATATGRIAAATGVEANVARQALQIASRAGTAEKAAVAMKAAGLSDNLVAPAMDAAKFLSSKNLVTGGAGRQIALQSGYAGISQMSSTYPEIMNRLMDEGKSFEEAKSEARLPAAIAGAITATITGLFSVAGRGGVEKATDPGQYTVKDLLRTGIWKELNDPVSRQIVKQTTRSLVKDAKDEAIEEGLDQFINGVAAFATDPSKATQDKRIGDVIADSVYAAGLGGAAGGVASIARNAQSTNTLTGQQIKVTETLREGLRKLDAAAKGESVSPTGVAKVTESVDADDVAKSLEEVANAQVEVVANDLAKNPDTSQTAQALAEIAGKEISTPKTDEPTTEPIADDLSPIQPVPRVGETEAGTLEAPDAAGLPAIPESPADPFTEATTQEQVNETEINEPEQAPQLAEGGETRTEDTSGNPFVEQQGVRAEDEGTVLPEVATTPAPETQSPVEEPMPLDRESLSSAELNSPGAPELQPRQADVAAVDTAKKSTNTGNVKSGLSIPDAPKESSKKSRDARDEVAAITADFLPALGGVFTGVEVIDSVPDGKTGGWYYNKSTGKLGIVLSDIARELGRVRDKKKWAATAIAEEAIHSVATKLERQGKFDAIGLIRSLKKDAPKLIERVQVIYPGAKTDRQLADEFLRMMVQGRMKFEIGKNRVRIDGELTEMQFTPGIIAKIKKIMRQLLNVVRDLQKKIKNKELAAELEEIAVMIEDTLKSLVEQETSRPDDEQFTWIADDLAKSQSPGKTGFTKLPKKQADGEGGFFDVYNVVGGPADGTTFMVPEGTPESEVQAAADAKTEQFSGKAFSQSVTPEKDAEYMAAVESGDMETAQRMVDEAARAAGYTVKGFHGTRNQFNAFSRKFVRDQLGFHFGLTEGQAVGPNGRIAKTNDFGEPTNPRLITAWLKLENPLELDDRGSWTRNVVIRQINDRAGTSLDEENSKDQKIVDALTEKGFDGIEYENVGEGEDGDRAVIVFNPNQIKSADPVTRDADGNVILLSQRFNPERDEIAYSQSPGSQRAQEMGVPALGAERINESRERIQKAVRDEIFDASKMEVDNPDHYQEAHDLINALTKGDTEKALREFRDKVRGHPDIEGLPNDLVALAAVIYGEITRYAIRQAVDPSNGRSVDFSLFRQVVNNYNKLPAGTLKLLAGEMDEDASATTNAGRILASLKEVAEPLGPLRKWFEMNANEGLKGMVKSGFNQEEINAITDFFAKPKKGKEYTEAVESAADTAAEKVAPVDAALGRLQQQAKKKQARKPKEETPSDKLVREVGEQVAQAEDFAARVEDEGEKARKAESDDLMKEVGDDIAKEEDFAKRLQKQEYDFDKAADKAIQRLMARYASPSNKPVGVKEIVEAMMEHPEMVSNPAWRKKVITEWMEGMGIEIPRITLDKLDILIANIFADAEVKLLKDFNAKRENKIQPTQLDKLVKAIKTGMVTGAPVEWQAAFAEKFGTRALTPDEMRDVLHYSSVIDNAGGDYLRQDQVVANGKISEIFRKAGPPPGFWNILAASFTQSALTGISTQTLQFTSSLVNWASRIYEDVVAGKGVGPVLNGIQLAFDAYMKAFHAARINDNYREGVLDEIARLSTLKTHLENKVKAFRDAKGLAKAKHVPGLMVGAQDFFRRLMSSGDDAAVAGLRAYIGAVATQSELRKAGISQKQIDRMFELAKEQMATLEHEAEWQKNRPDYTESNYQAWAMDKVIKELNASMRDALAEKLVAQDSEKDAQEIFDEIDSYSQREAQMDVGVGKLRDKIADKGMTPKEAARNILSDPLQFLGELIIGKWLEKHLRLNPSDTDPSAPIQNIIARMVFGFLRTPWNLMSRSVYRGPLGLWRLLVSGAIMPGKFSERAARMYARTMADARQQAQRRREGLIWTLTMAILYGVAKGLSDDEEENDPIIINGQGPSDEQAKAAWRAAGHQPNSIEINMGGTKLSIPFGRSGLEPLKPAMMMMGTLDDLRLNGMSKGEPENLWQFAKAYGNSTIYNASLFGFRNIANWRQDTSGENAMVKRIAYSLSPLIPFSGLTKSIGKFVRPGKPDDKTLAGAIAVSTPVFWIGEDAKNLYGQSVYGTPSSTTGDVTKRLMYGAGLPFSVDAQSDKKAVDVYEFSLKTGRAPAVPRREEIDRRLLRADKNHLPMTDKQWLDYQMAAGKERFESMKQFAPRSEGMSESVIERNLDVINTRADRAGRRAIQK